MSEISVPKHPTHTVRHIDNWDGEKNVITSLAFMHEGSYFCHESGKPLMTYVGDEVLQVWTLNEESKSQIYGDGWYDGFLVAKELAVKGEDLTDYTEDDAMKFSEQAEDERAKRLKS
jgi:hypothetical protein